MAAADSVFYCRHFFPRTFRQPSPEYHRDFWRGFDDINYDLFAAEIFRGGAKTTLTRAGTSKRIAFGFSRNILFIAINETMASTGVRWLKKQVETESYWAQTFQLIKGDKWTDTWIEIINVPLDMRINVVAKGITSGIRGLNFEDWRPDFIACDDISNEETVGTPEQRTKNKELFFGTIVPALAPKTEAPTRKLVLLQTGLHKEDIVNEAHNDPAFRTVKYPKLVADPVTQEPRSAWEDRYPTEEVLREQESYLRRNQYHVWLREFGCKIVSRETSPLNPDWLRRYKALPTDLVWFLGLDPAISKDPNAHKAAAACVGISRKTGDIYLGPYMSQRGKNPDELWTWVLMHWRLLRPRKVGVETVAFQKMLAWYFRQKMQETRTFFYIDEINDRRSKPDRIIQAYSGPASNGKFWVSENDTEFVQGFTDWNEDIDWDLGDAGAMAITMALGLAPSSLDADDFIDDYTQDEKEIPDLVFDGGAP